MRPDPAAFHAPLLEDVTAAAGAAFSEAYLPDASPARREEFRLGVESVVYASVLAYLDGLSVLVRGN